MELTNQQILADILIDARKRKGMSQRRLSVMTGVSHTEINKIEHALRQKPQPDILKKLSDALDLDYEEILEAIGYIDTEFDDNRYLLNENEKDFIVDAIVDTWQKNNSNTSSEFNNKENVYRIIFNQKSKRNEIDIPDKIYDLISSICEKSSEKQMLKFKTLCEWFIDSEFSGS